jgi:GNAT superfamily N-acetyltransferase
MQFVEADENDADAIAALHAASWRSAYRGILPDVFLDGDVVANRQHVWRQRLRAPLPNQVVVKALRDGTLCGFACTYLDADPQWGALLDNLHVSPSGTGLGVGAQLLADARARAHASRRGSPLHLWVFEANTRARRFYDRHGGHVTEHAIVEVLPGISVPELRYVFPHHSY